MTVKDLQLLVSGAPPDLPLFVSYDGYLQAVDAIEVHERAVIFFDDAEDCKDYDWDRAIADELDDA